MGEANVLRTRLERGNKDEQGEKEINAIMQGGEGEKMRERRERERERERESERDG